MTEAQIVDIINAAAFLVWWVFVLIGFVSTATRVAYYRAKGYRMPLLLFRDVSLFGGLATSFGLILGARASDLATLINLRDSIVWSLLTVLPALYGVAVFVYFEVFVIEKGDNRRSEMRDMRGIPPLPTREASEEEREDVMAWLDGHPSPNELPADGDAEDSRSA